MAKPRRAGAARRGSARIENSAGGVVVRWVRGAPHILLIRDAYRQWGFPKGHVEPGERPEAAALREVTEETGLDDLVLGQRLESIDWYFRLHGRLVHKFCTFYLIESPAGEACPQLEEGITDCRWLPLDEAVQTISYDNARQVLRQAGEVLGAPEGAVGRNS